MAIAVGQYIPVTSNVNNEISGNKVFAGLSLTSNPLLPTTNILQKFRSTQEVAEFFGNPSLEYSCAVQYFTKKTGVTLTPPYIYFGKYIIVAIAPYLHSASNTNTASLLSSLVAITAGDITVNVNGTAYPTTAINLSTATSLSMVASLLTTAIITANTALNATGANFVISYNGVTKQFEASIPATGTTKTMNYFSSTNITTGLATVLRFTQVTNAILSQGSDALTLQENMTALSQKFTDQFTIFFNDTMNGNLTDVINLEMAQWIHEQGDAYNFNCWSNEPALESSNDTTSIWYLITQANLNNTSIFDEVLYNTSDRASATAGVFASIDLSQPSSAITLAFKSQNGLLPSVTSGTIATILDNKKINYYGSITIPGLATSTTNPINFFYGGYTSGKWQYIDNLVGQIWIAIQCQVNILNELSTLTEIINDPDGQALIRTAITQAVQSALNAKIIVIGLTYDSVTAAEVLATYGANVQELTNNGYIILNTLASQVLRQERQSSVWYVLYAKGSAIQLIPINTTTFY